MHEFSYNSDLIAGSLLVRECRVIAELLLEQAGQSTWKQAIQVENRLQKRSPATALRQARALRQRLELLDQPFWRALRDGDNEQATQVAFVATLARNLLLVEFVETVIRDAFILQTGGLARYQWLDFLEDRAHRDPAIKGWAESSKIKMGQVVFRILREVGLLQKGRTLKLQHILVRPEVKKLLQESRRDRIQACLNVGART